MSPSATDSPTSPPHASGLRSSDVSEADRGQIKSRERVRDLAEVYTHDCEVHAMLDLIPDMFESIDSTFLEPACGDGNFLVEILRRKLAQIPESSQEGTGPVFEFAVLRAVASIYAIDISFENVSEARHRMRAVVGKAVSQRGVAETPRFRAALEVILATNVVCGDTLNDASEIHFTEWKGVEGEMFVRTPSPFEEPEHDLFYVEPEPLVPIHYTELGTETRS